MNKEDSSQNRRSQNLVETALKAMRGRYVVVGMSRIPLWKAGIFIGLLAGAVAGVLMVSNRSGEVEEGRATPDKTEIVSGDFSIAEPEFASSSGERHAKGEIIIKYKEGLAPARNALGPEGAISSSMAIFPEASGVTSAEMILNQHTFQDRSTKERVRVNGLDRLFVVRLASGKNIQQSVALLEADPRVEFAEPNYALSIFAIPNDPNFSELWGLHNTGQRIRGKYGTLDSDIDGPEAWDIAKGSSVVVGVIDTGIDYTHEDLAANIWTNPGEIPGDGKDNDKNGFIDDIHGWDFFNKDNDPMDDYAHGTHVAGTIGAVGNNSIGVTGVNWSVKIAALKFLSYAGSGRVSDAVKALAYADMMGMKVTNNSYGCYAKKKNYSAKCNSRALYNAIAASNSLGNLFVASAGNENFNNDDPVTAAFPASYDLPNIISVAATDSDDVKASFSNYGAISVDLGAPGDNILSSVPKRQRTCPPPTRKAGTCQPCSRCDPSGYKMFSGTSMSAPHVVGAVAIFWSARPALTNMEVKGAILNSVDPISTLAGKTVSGGRLNLDKLLKSP